MVVPWNKLIGMYKWYWKIMLPIVVIFFIALFFIFIYMVTLIQ